MSFTGSGIDTFPSAIGRPRFAGAADAFQTHLRRWTGVAALSTGMLVYVEIEAAVVALGEAVFAGSADDRSTAGMRKN